MVVILLSRLGYSGLKALVIGRPLFDYNFGWLNKLSLSTQGKINKLFYSFFSLHVRIDLYRDLLSVLFLYVGTAPCEETCELSLECSTPVCRGSSCYF